MNGVNADPLFQFLRTNSPLYNPVNGSVKQIPWNFAKFLLDGRGQVVNYYPPATEPSALVSDISATLLKSLFWE